MPNTINQWRHLLQIGAVNAKAVESLLAAGRAVESDVVGLYENDPDGVISHVGSVFYAIQRREGRRILLRVTPEGPAEHVSANRETVLRFVADLRTHVFLPQICAIAEPTPTCCDKHKAFGLGIGGFCDGTVKIPETTELVAGSGVHYGEPKCPK